MRFRWVLWLVGVPLWAVLVSCDRPACELAPLDRPSVVIVMIDTLRADHTEHHGYARPTTPSLTELSRGGATFTAALATSPWTGPSVCSLITGKYHDELGLRALPDPLPSSETTLAERLQALGYATAAVTSNGFVSEEFGHTQGYDSFHHEAYKGEDGRPSFTADRVTDAALEWLENAEPPFLLYVHYTDPHEPYMPPDSWRDRFVADPELLSDSFIQEKRYIGQRLDRTQLDALIGLYDAEIAFVDHEVGRLLREIPDNSLVIATGDHGEEFLDHGGFLHGHSVFEELVHVPLVFRGPGVCPGVGVDEPVSHVDVVPTILDLLGQAPDEALSGRSVRRQLEGRRADAERLIFSSRESTQHKEIAARRGRWKLILDLRGNARLFDLSADPDETTSLARRDDPLTQDLAQAVLQRQERIDALRRQETSEDLEERIEKLRFLGYVN